MAPIIAPFEFDESVFYGEGVQVMCHVSKGDKPLDFKWSFNGGEVSLLTGLTIMNVGDMGSALIIPAVTAKHAGNYTCTASNIVARASHHATLNVKGIRHKFTMHNSRCFLCSFPLQTFLLKLIVSQSKRLHVKFLLDVFFSRTNYIPV